MGARGLGQGLELGLGLELQYAGATAKGDWIADQIHEMTACIVTMQASHQPDDEPETPAPWCSTRKVTGVSGLESVYRALHSCPWCELSGSDTHGCHEAVGC